ncbi:MAG: hypothetical protein ACJ786_10450 [Catenulispora sp.]
MRPKVFTAVLAASGWLALAATGLPPASAGRIAVALAFLVICPGAAVMRLVAATGRGPDRYEPLLAAALTVAASLAVATLTSEAFFLTGTYTMTRCLCALAALTSVTAFAAGYLDPR